MKIIIVNFRYFISGGPERYLFNIKDLLEQNGHEVIPFSIQHNRNVDSPYKSFFLDQVGNGDEIYSHEYKKDIRTILQTTTRMIYSSEAKRKFKLLLNEVKPDIIYIIHFQNKISCSIIDAAYELKIPMVQRISDFSHICPNVILFRKGKGICEDCIEKGLFQAIKHKCISNSFIASTFKAFSLDVMNRLRIKDKIDAFVFPSTFTLQKYSQAGFNSEKLHHIPTFFNPNFLKDIFKIRYENFALFIGRIEKEKGIQTLINAFINTDYSLKVIGFSNDDYEEILKMQLVGKKHNIEFLGKMDFNGISKYLSNCLFTIVPSECYDNFPNTILESFAFKKPVIATNIGSLPEIVNENTGCTFEYANSNSLKEKITVLFNNIDEAKKLGEMGYLELIEKYSSENHYAKLINLFENVISGD